MTDKGTVRMVVIGLILINIVLLVGAFVLITTDHTVPDPIWSLGGVALGGLTGLLVSTRSQPVPPPEEQP